MTEKWKPIKGYEGYYKVSNMGRVRSVDRRIFHADGKICNYKGVILSQSFCGDKREHPKVKLSMEGVQTSFKISRLVATHFIPNPDNKPEVLHIDGRKDKNEVSNLRWATSSECTIHCYKIGLMGTDDK